MALTHADTGNASSLNYHIDVIYIKTIMYDAKAFFVNFLSIITTIRYDIILRLVARLVQRIDVSAVSQTGPALPVFMATCRLLRFDR
jgi:hypothetical protein